VIGWLKKVLKNENPNRKHIFLAASEICKIIDMDGGSNHPASHSSRI
jgi:hypothetical protein